LQTVQTDTVSICEQYTFTVRLFEFAIENYKNVLVLYLFIHPFNYRTQELKEIS